MEFTGTCGFGWLKGWSGLISGDAIVCNGVLIFYCSVRLIYRSWIEESSSDMNVADSIGYWGKISGELKQPLISFVCSYWFLFSFYSLNNSFFWCISLMTFSVYFSDDLKGVISLGKLRVLKFLRWCGCYTVLGPSGHAFACESGN